MTAKRLTLCACVFAICSALYAQPSRDVEAVARRLYERYGAGDLDGAMALWSPAAPDRDAFRASLAGILRVRCVEVRDVGVTRVEVAGNRAVADVTVSLVKWSLHTGAWRPQTDFATLTFGRDGGGAWLLTGWKRQEEGLADALMAAKSAEERWCILASQRGLVTPVLDEILERRALQLINQDRIADAASVVRLMETIAADIADLSGMASARSLDSILFRRQSQWDLGDSFRAAQESVLLAGASGSSEVLSRSLLRLGRAERWSYVEPFGKASFLRALDLIDDVEDASAVAMAVGGLAEYYDLIGDRRGALRYALMSRDLAAAHGDRVSQLNAEVHVAGTYLHDAQCELAIPHLERLVSIAHAANVTGSVPADALYNAAVCHLNLGHEAAFLSAMKRAAAERGQDMEVPAVSATLLARYRLDHGDLLGAANEAEKAGRAARTIVDRGIKDGAFGILSAVRLRQGRAGEALAAAQEIRGDLPRRSLSGSAYRALGRRVEAYRQFRAAIDGVEDGLADFDARQSEVQFSGRAVTPKRSMSWSAAKAAPCSTSFAAAVERRWR
jgi:tetratricopeptide (TPR) repeat protein